jgi:hypothetical protein
METMALLRRQTNRCGSAANLAMMEQLEDRETLAPVRPARPAPPPGAPHLPGGTLTDRRFAPSPALAVLAALLALLAFSGCGLVLGDPQPNSSTSAAVDGMQSITEAVANHILPPDTQTGSLPLSTGGGVTSGDDSGLSGTIDQLAAALGGTSLPMGAPTFDAALVYCGNDQLHGTFVLNGTANVTDNRPSPPTIEISIPPSLSVGTFVNCSGNGVIIISGTINVTATDTLTIVSTSDSTIDAWTLDRDESASGNLQVKVGTMTHTINPFSWSRVGTIDFTVYNSKSLDVNHPPGSLASVGSVTQTLDVTANSQVCHGSYTPNIYSFPYQWVCNH